MPDEIRAWRERGRFLEVDRREVFVVDAGPADAVPLVVLHGFPTSSFDFRHVLGALAERFRVVVHDHLGFGLSEKPRDYSYSLVEQADVALGVWRALGIERAHLVAHDYGTSVATELLARRERGLAPVDLASVTLANGSVHLELARLSLPQRVLRSRWIGPWFARRARKIVFVAQMRRILGDPASVPRRELDLMWWLLVHRGGRDVTARISGYLDERMRFWHRWIGALERLDLDAHVLWGRRDPIAVAAIAERLAAEIPRARLTWLDDLGHYPMVEAPERWARAVLAVLEG